MKDLSHLGKVDSSTLQYAEQQERTKYWFERSNLELRKSFPYTSVSKYKLSEEEMNHDERQSAVR